MTDRRGIILLMFDLPVKTAEDRREYTHFRKNLRLQGFLQLQESCYLKLVRNTEFMEQSLAKLKTAMPAGGNVSVLPMGLSVFMGMRCLLGEAFDLALFTEDIYCIGGDDEPESA